MLLTRNPLTPPPPPPDIVELLNCRFPIPRFSGSHCNVIFKIENKYVLKIGHRNCFIKIEDSQFDYLNISASSGGTHSTSLPPSVTFLSVFTRFPTLLPVRIFSLMYSWEIRSLYSETLGVVNILNNTKIYTHVNHVFWNMLVFILINKISWKITWARITNI